MKNIALLVLVACVACQVSTQDDEAKPAVSRGLLKRGQLPKGKQTTTTTTPAPQDDAEYEEGDYPAEGEAQEASTEAPVSSTEGKKLVGAGLRPFRSNADLLETLKKRRAQAAEAKLRGPTVSNAEAKAEADSEGSVEPAKSNYVKKRFNNSPAKEAQPQVNEEPAAAKPARGRFGRPATRSVVQEEEPSEVPARSARAFSRRGGN